MHALYATHSWGWLMMVAGIFGWSALMLLLAYLLTKRRRPRPAPPDPAGPRRPTARP